MADQDKPNTGNDQENPNENRNMFIASAVIVLIILGGMGINMLIHHDTNAGTVETSGSPQ